MTEQIGLQALFETQAFQAGLSQYMSGINQATGATERAASTTSSAGSIIATGLGVALGTVLVQAAGAAVQALQNFVTSGIESVGTLQRMQIMLESLAARELLHAGTVKTMAEAMAQAGPIASVLLDRLKELSLTSPFEYQDIVNVFRLNMAYGATASSALDMTSAVLNLAAAMGMSSDQMTRVVYSMSQIQNTGKISARELRELSMAGVNLADILSDQLGMSIDEVNAALADGSLTMAQVTQAFTNFANTNFAGAAERMSLTLQGLQSSFKDLAFFASKDLFGPLVEKITADLGGLFQSARQLLDSGALTGIGEALASAYDAAKQVPQAIGGVISSLDKMFGGGINKLINNAFNWGVQIIANLASGIMDGIASFLVAAMNAVSSLLSYWLSPGSPPKVAPNIDQWGESAMEEFLNGFTNADFSALDSLQGALNSAFNSLNLGDEKSSQLMTSLSQQFSEALSTGGTLDQSFFDQLTQAAGPYGDEIARLASLNLDLSNSTEAVAAAENKVSDAQKKEQAARQKSAALVNEYNDLLKQGASEDVLKSKRDEINAQEQIAADAANQEAAAQNDLDLQKAKVDLLSEQVDLQEKLIQQLTELYAVQDQGTGAGGGTTDTGGGETAGGGGGGAGGGAATGGTFISDLQTMLDQAQTMVDGSSTSMRDTIIGKLMGVFEPIMNAWTNTILPKLTELYARFVAFIADLQSKWDLFTAQLITAFQPVAAWWSQTWPQLQAIFAGAWGIIQGVFAAAWSAIQPALDQMNQLILASGIDLNQLAAVALALGQILVGVVVAGVFLLVAGFTVLLGLLVGIVSGFMNAITVSQTFITGMVNGFVMMLSGIGQAFQGFFDILVATMNGNLALLLTGFQELGSGILNIIQGTLGAMVSMFIIPIAAILGFIAGFVKGVVGYFQGLADQLIGHSIIPDMLKAIQEAIQDSFDDLLKTIGDFIAQTEDGFTDWITALVKIINDGLTAAQTAISQRYTTLFTMGSNIIHQIALGAQSQQGTLQAAIASVISGAIAAIPVNDTQAAAQAIGEAIIAGITDGIESNKNDLFASMFDLGQSLMTNLSDGVNSKSAMVIGDVRGAVVSAYQAGVAYIDDFYQLGVRLMEAMGAGIASATQSVVDQINSSMDQIIAAIQAKIDEQNSAAAAPLSLASYPGGQSYAASRLSPVPILSNSRTLNMPMNVYLSNGMDTAQFESLVRRIVRSEFGL